jgi:hypothetical protein
MSEDLWRPTIALRILLWWTALTFLTAWLPIVRGAFDGASYQWGTVYFGRPFSGIGLSGDIWLPIARVALGLLILVLGWRGARRPFAYLLVAWQALGFADALHSAVTRPEGFRFRGDTLGVDFSLAWLAPCLYAIALALAIWWFVRERNLRLDRDPGWHQANYFWLGALAALLPVQFALLRYGAPDGSADQFGVLLTVAQWLLIGVAIRPRAASKYPL